jgi:hypothetical protein
MAAVTTIHSKSETMPQDMTSASSSLPAGPRSWKEIAETLNAWCSVSTSTTTIEELLRVKCQWPQPFPGDGDDTVVEATKVLLLPVESFQNRSIVSRSLLKKMTLLQMNETLPSEVQEEKESTSPTLRKQLQLQIALRLHLWLWAGSSFVQHYQTAFSKRKRNNSKTKSKKQLNAPTTKQSTHFEKDVIKLLQQVAFLLPPQLSLAKFIHTECAITPQHLKLLGPQLQFIWDAFELQNPFVDPPSPSESGELQPLEMARKRQRIKRTESSKTSQPNHSKTRSPFLPITNSSLTAPSRPSNPLLKEKTRFVGSHFNSQRTQNMLFCPAGQKKRSLPTGSPSETQPLTANPLRGNKPPTDRSEVPIAMSVQTTQKQKAMLSSETTQSPATGQGTSNTQPATSIFSTTSTTIDHSQVKTSTLVAEAMQALQQRRRRQQQLQAK